MQEMMSKEFQKRGKDVKREREISKIMCMEKKRKKEREREKEKKRKEREREREREREETQERYEEG
jgi:RNA-binding protein 39